MADIILGIPEFEIIRTQDIMYIDKTSQIYTIIRKSGYYFLSRPRRFGKTLLLSTIEKIFEGRRDLFKDLAIEKTDYAWPKHPVIRLSMAEINCDSLERFKEDLAATLDGMAEERRINLGKFTTASAKLRELVRALHKKSKKPVVLLIDEYDGPLLSHLANAEEAEHFRNELAQFYGVIKGLGKHLHVVFLTGVTKFSKTSIFSKLNNLADLSLNEDMAALVGYTESEVGDYFKKYHADTATKLGLTLIELREKVQHWYNGFRFSAAPIRVYNPHSVMAFYYNKWFDNFWYATGTPSFLYELIKQKRIDVAKMLPARMIRSGGTAFEPRNIPLLHLLFQCGYITIVDVDERRNEFVLDFPNNEVKTSWLTGLLESLVNLQRYDGPQLINNLYDALEVGNVSRFCAYLKDLFASIPYSLHIESEAYFHSIVYIITKLMEGRLQTEAEQPTNKGAADLVVQMPKRIFIFEFKFRKSAKFAFSQIKRQKYYERYHQSGLPITLVGMSFYDRNVSGEPVVELIKPVKIGNLTKQSS